MYSILQHGTLVLSSHVRYDELLTTGWNEALADEHHVSSSSSGNDHASSTTSPKRICIQGYKDDPERRIGLIGTIKASHTSSIADYAACLSEAFQGHEFLHLDSPSSSDKAAGSTQIKAVASLNAFTPEIIDRIQDSLATLDSDGGNNKIQPSEVLCLTGAARELGINAAKELGFSVIAVGHKRCEFEGLEVVVLENEEEPVHVKKEQQQQTQTQANGKGGSRRNGGKVLHANQ
jgi:putative NIF3 family GTP cyclohydrolase 1 type 2